MNHENLLKLEPAEDYQKPNFPTFQEKCPNLENKIPKRWQRKGILTAATTILGLTALTGCGAIIPERNIYCPDLHFGGAGGAPQYVVILTEQEVIDVILAQTSAVGIEFTEVAPTRGVMVDSIYMESDWGGEASRLFNHEIELILINEEHGIGIVLDASLFQWNWGQDNHASCFEAATGRIQDKFLREHNIQIEFIPRRNQWIDELDYWNEEWFEEGTEEQIAFEERRERFEADQEAATLSLMSRLEEDIQAFIAQLKEEGIIQ